MYLYSAFGLIVASNHALPALVEADQPGAPDVTLWAGLRPDVETETIEPLFGSNGVADHDGEQRVDRLQPSGILWLRYVDGTEFYIAPQGQAVWGIWMAPFTLEDMATYFLGPVLGIVLRLRQTIALHASSIAINGRGIALVGAAGAGKSTTAAQFALAGVTVLADDVTPLVYHENEFRIHPAYPHLRLWPDSAKALLGSACALEPITPNWDKLDFPLISHGSPGVGALPLDAIYVLGARTSNERAPYVESLTPQARFLSLVRNTYGNAFLDRAMRAHEFQILSHLVTRVSIRQVVPHISATRLKQMCQAIVQDFHSQAHAVECSGESLAVQHV